MGNKKYSKHVRFFRYFISILVLMISTSLRADVVVDTYEIEFEDIKDALFQRNYDYALKLARDYLFQQTRQEEFLKKGIKVLMSKLADETGQPFENDTLSYEEQIRLISVGLNEKLEESGSQAYGQSSLILRHSVEHGLTRLEWNENVEVDTCRGYYYGMRCDAYGENCVQTVEHYTDYAKKHPNHRIYRIINGQEELIGQLNGNLKVHRESISFGGNLFDTIKDIYKYDWSYDIDVPEGKAFWTDFDSNIREDNSTLEYKVVSNNSPFKYGDCGSSETYMSAAPSDMDGDGRMDYLSSEEYDRYFGKYYGWIIPVVTSLLL